MSCTVAVRSIAPAWGRCLGRIGRGLLRYGLVVLLLWLGAFKFTQTEALAIQPLIANSPLLAWLYEVLTVGTVSKLIGATEIGVALLILLPPVSRWLSAVAGLAAVGIFLTTLSFLLSTPGMWRRVEGLVVPSDAGAFLLKDLLLLGAACLVAGEALAASSPTDGAPE